MLRFAFSSALTLALALTLSAADWPQFRGPNRDGVSKETGLLKEWPKDGPTLVWKATGLGGGFSTPSVAKGQIFGMSFRGDDEVVWALEEATGKEVWTTKIAKSVKLDHGSGSRCTPTIDGDKLYALGVSGDLVCMDAAKGSEVWHKNLTSKDLGGGRPGWGYCESILIDGEKLICTPGGKNTIVAMNKATGETLWKSTLPKAEGAQYSSAIAVEIGSQRQYVQFVKGGVISVGASDGAFLWRYDHPANGTANCSMPLFSDGAVFAASNYGNGGGLVQVTKADDKFEAKETYFDKAMQNHHGGMVLVDGYIYGTGSGSLRCIEFKTGKVMWDERKPGKGSVTYADGHIYCRHERDKGTVFLVEANPKEYVEKGQFAQPERSKLNAWAYPVVANGKLYLRDQDIMLCYDIKAK